MRIQTIFIFLVPLLVLFGGGWYSLHRETISFVKEVANLSATLLQIENENKKTKENIYYFQKKENLVKELKSQFNYKEPGEKLLIVVSKNAVSTDTPTSSSAH